MGYFIVGFILYIIIGILWANHVFNEQMRIYPQSSETRVLFVFMTNFTIWPICMIVAAIRKITGKTLG